MIFDQYSIVSNVVKFLNATDLDNFESFPDDVVKDCCVLEKREIFKNRWLRFDYFLSKHPKFISSNPFSKRSSEKNLVNSYYGLYVYVTFDKKSKRTFLNLESVYGSLVQFNYETPHLFEDVPESDIFKTQMFVVPKYFSTRNQISHIVRARIKQTFVYFDIDIGYFILDNKNHSMSPSIIISANIDLEENEGGITFKEIFGDEYIGEFPHLSKTRETLKFKNVEPLEYSYKSEVFVDEDDKDCFFYDDLVMNDAIVLKIMHNGIVQYLKVHNPFEFLISSTKVLGQKFYSIINYDSTIIQIFDLVVKFLDPDVLPLFEMKSTNIIYIQYVCDDYVMIFSKDANNTDNTNKVHLVSLFSQKVTDLSQKFQNLLNFNHLQISFAKDENKNNVLMMFIDLNSKPECIYLF